MFLPAKNAPVNAVKSLLLLGFGEILERYHFDMVRRPLSLIQQGLFNGRSEFVQNSRRRNLDFQRLQAAGVRIDRGRPIAQMTEQRLRVDATLLHV